MARIPRRDEAGVGLNAIPGNRVSSPAPIEAFGDQRAQDIAGVGKALGQLGDAALNEYQKEKKRNEDAVVSAKLHEAEMRADEALRSVPRDEYITSEPKHAESLTSRSLAEVDKIHSEIRGSIADPRLQKRLDERLLESRQLRERRIAQEEAKAWDELNLGKLSKTVEDATAAATEANMDGPAREYHIRRAQEAAKIAAEIKGDFSGETEARVNGALYQSIILSDLDKQDVTSAKAMLQTGIEKKYLPAEAQEKLTEAVNSAQWFGDASLLVQKHGTENAALAAVPKDAAPKQRDEMTKTIKQQFAERERQRKQREEDNTRYANEYFDRTGKLPPAAVLEGMGSTARRALIKHRDKTAAGDTSFDDDTYRDLVDQMSLAKAEGRKWDVNLFELRDVLGSKYGTLVKMQSDWNDKVAEGSVTFDQRASLLAKDLPKEAKAMYEASLAEEISRVEAKDSRVLRFDEKMKIATNLLADTVIKRDWMPNSNRPAYALTPQQRDQLLVPGDDVEYLVPDDFRALPENQGASETVLQMRYRDKLLGI